MKSNKNMQVWAWKPPIFMQELVWNVHKNVTFLGLYYIYLYVCGVNSGPSGKDYGE